MKISGRIITWACIPGCVGAVVVGAALDGTLVGAHDGLLLGAADVGGPLGALDVLAFISITVLSIPEKSSSWSSAVEIDALSQDGGAAILTELNLETLPTPPEVTKVYDVLFATTDTSNDSGGDRELYQLSNSALYIAAMLACCGAESTWENAIVLVTVPVITGLVGAALGTPVGALVGAHDGLLLGPGVVGAPLGA